jgi:hypothetical protein
VKYGAAHNIIITLSKEEIHTNVKNMNARRDNDARVSNKRASRKRCCVVVVKSNDSEKNNNI